MTYDNTMRRDNQSNGGRDIHVVWDSHILTYYLWEREAQTGTFLSWKILHANWNHLSRVDRLR